MLQLLISFLLQSTGHWLSNSTTIPYTSIYDSQVINMECECDTTPFFRNVNTKRGPMTRSAVNIISGL